MQHVVIVIHLMLVLALIALVGTMVPIEHGILPLRRLLREGRSQFCDLSVVVVPLRPQRMVTLTGAMNELGSTSDREGFTSERARLPVKRMGNAPQSLDLVSIDVDAIARQPAFLGEDRSTLLLRRIHDGVELLNRHQPPGSGLDSVSHG